MRRSSAATNAGAAAMISPDPLRSRVAGSRGLAGIIALGMAMLLLLVVPAVLSSGVPGAASPQPLPAPPEVGSCVLIAWPSAAVASRSEPLQVVPCTQPHDGEVTMSWPSFVAPVASGTAGPNQQPFVVTSGASRLTYFQCEGWNADYLGTAAPLMELWQPSRPVTASALLYDTADGHYDRMHWSACVITPAISADRYVGSIRAAGSHPAADRPDAYMYCLGRGTYGATELTYVNCAAAHRVEPIGLDTDSQTSLPAEQALTECRALVAGVTGAPDPTFGGQLTIKVQPVGLRAMTEADAYASDDRHAQDCVVELAGQGSLTGSVVGIGDAALPVTP